MWNEGVIFEMNSSGLPIQVWERSGRRELRFGNNVVQSAMSLSLPDFLVLKYTRYMMLGFVLNPDADLILHIGLGGGCVPRFIHYHFLEARQKVIEQSRGVVQVASQFFDFPDDDRLRVETAEAGEWIQHCQERFSLIFFDAFGAHGTPKQLTTADFLKELRRCLLPDGWVIGNVWTSQVPPAQQLELWQSVFPQVLQAPTQPVGNIILYGGKSTEGVSIRNLRQRAIMLEKAVPLDFQMMARSFVITKSVQGLSSL